MDPKNESTELEVIEPSPMPTGIFANDPVEALAQAEKLVKAVSVRCTGKQFIVPIGKGDKVKQYPKVEWWTTVGAVLGLFPVIVSVEKENRGSGYVYLAKAEVRHNGNVITSGEAICSTEEKRWGYADEYAVKSMAQTRAVAKAYRIGLSFLATLAGLEPTPAEEVPPGGFGSKKEPEKPTLSQAEKTLAVKMHDYLIARFDNSTHAVEEEIKSIGKKLDIPEATDGKFNGMTGDEIRSFWQELCAEVEEFEGAGNKNSKEVQDV